MGELDRRVDRLEETLIRGHVNQKVAAMAPRLRRLGVPPEDWPRVRRLVDDSVRWDLAHPHPTAEQVEARIQHVAAEQAAVIGVTPEAIIAEAERIAGLLPEGQE